MAPALMGKPPRQAGKEHTIMFGIRISQAETRVGHYCCRSSKGKKRLATTNQGNDTWAYVSSPLEL